MAPWYYSKLELMNTPSVVHGMNLLVERQHRREGARFIIETCIKLNLGFKTMATGVVYYQRFYMMHSFFAFPHFPTACCAILVAGKVEETPKQVKEMIKIAKMYLQPAEFAKFGKDPQKELLVLERILLQTMNFDVIVHHPYDFLLDYCKLIDNGDRERHEEVEKILNKAWTLINDSLWSTTLCLEWEPEIVAIAMLNLAIRFNRYTIESWFGKENWWEEFVEGLTEDQIDGICHEVLDFCFHLPSPIDRHSATGNAKYQPQQSSRRSEPARKKQNVQYAKENKDPTTMRLSPPPYPSEFLSVSYSPPTPPALPTVSPPVKPTSSMPFAPVLSSSFSSLPPWQSASPTSRSSLPPWQLDSSTLPLPPPPSFGLQFISDTPFTLASERSSFMQINNDFPSSNPYAGPPFEGPPPFYQTRSFLP